MLTTLEDALKAFASYIALGLNFVAIVLIAIGAIEALWVVLRVSFATNATNSDRRDAWLGFAHWLVAALTFQLAADIVDTTVAPGWEDIGRVGAIAVIRTFLTYFLDRDIDSIRERQRSASQGVVASQPAPRPNAALTPDSTQGTHDG